MKTSVIIEVIGKAVTTSSFASIDTENKEEIREAMLDAASSYPLCEHHVIVKTPYQIIAEADITVGIEYFQSKGKLYCNEHFYSDCHAYEVIEVINGGKKLGIRRLKATEQSPCGNNWKLESDETEKVTYVKLYKNGCYGFSADSKRFKLSNHPHEYYDYEF